MFVDMNGIVYWSLLPGLFETRQFYDVMIVAEGFTGPSIFSLDYEGILLKRG